MGYMVLRARKRRNLSMRASYLFLKSVNELWRRKILERAWRRQQERLLRARPRFSTTCSLCRHACKSKRVWFCSVERTGWKTSGPGVIRWTDHVSCFQSDPRLPAPDRSRSVFSPEQSLLLATHWQLSSTNLFQYLLTYVPTVRVWSAL